MMCYLHYISASRRLHEAEKTVTMLSTNKYSERDVPEMVLAQRDFIKKEKEYFSDECVKWNFILLAITMISIVSTVIWKLPHG